VDQQVSIKRKLATILAADVAEYSRLMGEDEEATADRLTLYRGVFQRLVDAHDGRIFNTAGDSIVAEFASPVEAMRCAGEIQADIGARNAELPEARRMQFRIGVHLGDVLVDGDNLLGDGVNVAARLEGLARPGGIALSAAVHEHVEGKMAGTFRFEGEKSVKNIAKPVAVYTLATDAADAPATASPTLPATVPERIAAELPSIAVLPFENMGGDPEQDYFADGLAEDLITELARFQELRVVARNSSFTYKGKATNVRVLGEELGVRYVLEGSVRKAGNRVRIIAQLIEAATDKHLWAERYDRDMDDLFAVQDEVTQRIVATIAPTVEESERRRVRHAERCGDHRAYDAVLCAREKWSKFNEADNRVARRLYLRAIELDPEYARAYSGLAWTYLIEKLENWGEAPEQALGMAFENAQQAVKVNPASHSAWLVLGNVQRERGELKQSVAAINKAIELNPNDVDSYMFLANVKLNLGEIDDSLRLIERARELSTRITNWHKAVYGSALYAGGRYAEAVDVLESVTDLPFAQRILAMTYGQTGEAEKATAVARRFLQRYPDFSIAEFMSNKRFQREEDRAHYRDGLEKAGFPA
jgi:adenylate cyclase